MDRKQIPSMITQPQGASLYYKDSGMTIRMDLQEAERFIKDYHRPQDFTAPETVHIEITGECNLNCPYCYVLDNQRERNDGGRRETGGTGKEEEDREREEERKTGEALTIDGDQIDQGLSKDIFMDLFRQLAEMGVFQITFGGGEPFLRDDMVELAREADGLGLNVTVTTNGTLLTKFTKEELTVFRQINLSYHAHKDIDLRETVGYVVDAGIPCAVSFIVSKEYLDDLPGVVELVEETGTSILLLSYKPVHGDDDNVVPLEGIRMIAFGLRDKGVKVAIDSMLSNECYMSERLATISHEGDVHPCSFVRESQGNITDRSFADIWSSRSPKSLCPYAYLNEQQ